MQQSGIKSSVGTPVTRLDGSLNFGQTVSGNFLQHSKNKGGSRIKVAVRIRPLMDSEMHQGHSSTFIRAEEALRRIV